MRSRLPNIILTGDFNLPSIQWEENVTIDANPQYGLHIKELMLDIIDQLGLTQMVLQPTRMGNILDLVLTSVPDIVDDVAIGKGMSDHDAVTCHFSQHVKLVKTKTRKIYQFKKSNMDSLRDDLKESTNKILNDCVYKSASLCWNLLKEAIQKAVSSHVPVKNTKSRPNLPWWNKHLNRMARQKKRARLKAKVTNNDKDWSRYKLLQARFRSINREAHKIYLTTIFTTDHGERFSKKTFSYFKSRIKDTVGTPVLRLNGREASLPCDKAQMLNDHFCQVFTLEDPLPNTWHDEIGDGIDEDLPRLPDLTINIDGITKLLGSTKVKKAHGPDEIPNIILKEAKDEIAPVLTAIFQKSLDEGDIPVDWRSVNAVPIFKKGDRHWPQNYRPVSLTSHSCKILEHVIYRHIIQHLDDHNFLNEKQHGFRKHRSCESQLILTIEDLFRSFEQGTQQDAMILDFSKAFDKVPHQRLLFQLQKCGIQGQLLKWINIWLTTRSQRVVIDGECSVSAADQDHNRYTDMHMLCCSNPVAVFNIHEIQHAIEDTRNHLMFLHALTGYDTVSAIYRQDKRKAFDMVHKKRDYDLLDTFAGSGNTHDQVKRAEEAFILNLYGASSF
eukprot:XP_011669381.1 PREDICTED: uncharacterized protein LOC105440653 [Strongylocentrotus purpuratus]